jgi:two-component system sensor histidine kinase PilS (NtrC family)
MRRTDRLAAVGELSAGIAHEIRNPLASISGSVEVLKESLSPTGENERLLDLIIRESDRLNKIISEFLHFARLKTPDIQRLVLNDIVEDVFSLLQNHPQNHERIVMKNTLGPESIAVRFDEDHLRQLLINLMVNGLEAMPDGGELVVGLCANGMKPAMADTQYVKIFVSDSGTGIDESVRDRIFEPFISTKKNGTGLGLSIVQRILEYNHGKIDLGENRPKRVSFTVSLPRA